MGVTQVTRHGQVSSWRGEECLQPNPTLLLTHDTSYSEEPFRSSPPFDQSASCSCSSVAVSIAAHQELCCTVNKMRIFLRTPIRKQAIPCSLAGISASVTTDFLPAQKIVPRNTFGPGCPSLSANFQHKPHK